MGPHFGLKKNFCKKRQTKLLAVLLLNLLKSHPNPTHIYLSIYSGETGAHHAQEDNPLHLCQSGMSSVLPFYLH